MAFDQHAVGIQTEPTSFSYTWKDTVLYALGVGTPISDLEYLYEGRQSADEDGPPTQRVLPSFIVVPAVVPCFELLKKLSGSLEGIIHNAQSITLHAPLPSEATLETSAKIDAVYDLKRMTQIKVSTQSFHNKNLVAETTWDILYLLGGGFGGQRPPKADRVRVPDTKPDFIETYRTTPEQAALYRLNGDTNPLHIDANAAKAVDFETPILHGLCTFGFVTRALSKYADQKGQTIATLKGQFRKPIFPSDTLVINGWHNPNDNSLILKTTTQARPEEAALTNARAKLK